MQSSKTVVIQNSSRPLPAPLEAVYCQSFSCRLRGLMFRRELSPDQGLLLVQPRDSRLDSSIHMMFVWLDLGVVWVNAAGQVVDTCLALSWRPVYLPRRPARYVLEIVPERLGEFQVGDQVVFA